MTSPHVEVDLGAPSAHSEVDFEERSSRLETETTRAVAELSKARSHLSRRDASASSVTPHMERLEVLTSSVRRQLSTLAELNKSAARTGTVGPASLRIRVTRFGKHAREFSAFLTEFEAARESYRLLLDTGIRKGIAEVEPGLAQADVDDAMSRAGGLDRVLERARPELKWQVQDLRERNEQLAKLNRDVASLHEMFVELSFLTENQQGLINEIEHNVEEVKSDVKKADGEIIEAHKYQKSARKKKMIIAAIILLILIIIIVVVVLQVT